MATILFLIGLLALLGSFIRFSFSSLRTTTIITLILTIAIAFSWEWAVEQSERTITGWLANIELMRSLAVLLSIEVGLSLWLALLLLSNEMGELYGYRQYFMYFLCLFPGLLLPVVAFAMVVWATFQLSGVDFKLISSGVAVAFMIALPVGRQFMLWLIPEKLLRIECFFLLYALIALLGIFATVDGQTTIKENFQIDFLALLTIILVNIIGILAGWGWYLIRKHFQFRKS